MRVPLSWLRDYVSLDGIAPDALAERLTLAGLEVAHIEYLGVPGPDGSGHLVWGRETIYVGEVVGVEPHPNADRLRLVTVAYGDDRPRTVVTGAPNVRVGQKVAYATTGATIINGYSEAREHVTLESKTLRGILSEGTVLSERELGLSDEHEGILELAEEAPVGTPLQDYLGDVVLDIELTPNLGRAASIVGVAREVAALFDRELHLPSLELNGTGAPVSDAIRIEIKVPDVNPRFTATLIRDVTIGPSPAWMQRRLRLVGQRPINNVVDVTNYVMMELGQPLHAFDYDKLVARAARSGAATPTIIMRMAKPGETLTTLDDVPRRLSPQDILVTDTAGILSIAGIMGGAETEVSDETTNVLLEAASWDFITTRRSSMRHTLFTEAAYRFSRNVHPAMALRGNQRGAQLIAELAEGELAAGLVDAYPNEPEPIHIELEPSLVRRLLGVELSPDEIADTLRRLAFEVERAGDHLHVHVPDHRTDVAIPADLVEEVARVYGLDNLPETLMDDLISPIPVNRARLLEERVRDLLVGMGLTETIAYRMTAPERDALLQPHPDAAAGSEDVSEAGYVCLANPISRERRVMRRNLLVSAMETLQANLRHRDRAQIFEVGLAYLPRDGTALPDELRRVVIALTGPTEPTTWLTPASEPSDYWAIKGVVDELVRHLHLADRVGYEASEHPTFQPGRTATLTLNGAAVGVLGELHPLVRRNHDLPEQRIAMAEIALDPLLAAVPDSYTVEPVGRFPSVMQDLAAVVDEAVPAAEVERLIRRTGGERLEHVALFDVYRGPSIPEGTKSLAYALRYRHPDKTLTDEEVAAYHGEITAALREGLGAKIRGEDL